jgi:hypothetical protein
MKPKSTPIEIQGSTPFQKMNNLFRAVVVVPKAGGSIGAKSNARKLTARSGRKQARDSATIRQQLLLEVETARMRHALPKSEVK